MPPEGASGEEIEAGDVPGLPRPREHDRLVGHAEAERALLDALAAGRLHHAWLIGGPRGIGKATLAYRVARRLLTGGDERAPVPEAVTRQVAALSHPNLVTLRRARTPDRKTMPTAIPVDAVRRALALFESTAAGAGYRVCLVDGAEELTVAAANALLKMIEEPPARSIFLLVSHAPARVLPTIRSRCRRLLVRPLSTAELSSVIRSLGSPWDDIPSDVLSRAVARADGSVSRALELLDPAAAALAAEVEALLAAGARLDDRRVLALAERLAPREAEPLWALCLDIVTAFVAHELERRRDEPAARLARLVDVCDKVALVSREAAIYNLDRRPLVLSLFDDLAQAAI